MLMLYLSCVLFVFKCLSDGTIDEEDEHDYWDRNED